MHTPYVKQMSMRPMILGTEGKRRKRRVGWSVDRGVDKHFALRKVL